MKPSTTSSRAIEYAAQEILRPLREFVQLSLEGHKLTAQIIKPGLTLWERPLDPIELSAKFASLKTLAAWVRMVQHDNLQNSLLNAKPHWPTIEKYSPEDFTADKAALEKLYAHEFISPEKKDLVADLENSQGHYIMSANNPQLRIFDAASQIASLNLGFNSTKRQSLLMRPESQGFVASKDKSDLETSLGNILRRKSGLPHVVFLNSGSEANDFCLSNFKLMFPKRAKVFAFEGSFHGRTLLALHTTHSPTKREPFEIYKGLVDFFTFPENKTPADQKPEPDQWLSYWSCTTETHKNPIFLGWLKLGNALLSKEIAVLERIRKEFQSGNLPFALIIEPMQCEGGDRYATSRFMRALRVLTRAFDVPLIYDEVQTGFGLGGPFFWHTLFKLEDANGKPEFPDAITVAKKAQVAACISAQEWKPPAAPSPSGLHRGYIQAQAAIEGPEVDDLAPLALKCLEAFQTDTIKDWVQHPRGQAFAFAFDLPSAEIAAELIKVRFENGILIYPAGDRTLRFRLMVSTRRRDLYELYSALYGCFESIAAHHSLNLRSSLDSFQTTLKTILGLDDFDLNHKYTETVTKDQATLPQSISELSQLDCQKWQKTFKTLVRLHPDLVWQTTYDLQSLKKATSKELIEKYQNPDFSFTWLNLLWELSRKNSFEVVSWTDKDIASNRKQINELQIATYEPVRRASADDLIELAKDPRTLALVCVSENQNLAGMCFAIPLDKAEDLPFFTHAPSVVHTDDLYSMDLTVNESHRSNGLGLRLKVEQLIAARLLGKRRITSRNRYPEAKAMSRLNQKMGSVVCHISNTDYGGTGTGWYQSVEFRKPSAPLKIFQNTSTLLNKMCLSNFVSPAYINFLQIWRETIPTKYRHLYLSSGESEALDKWLKTLFTKRPKAHYALSFFGDHFGTGTAAARSLGGDLGTPSPFEWPRFKSDNTVVAQLNKYLEANSSEEILGFFIEPKSKPWLAELIATCKQHNIPVVFNETRSMLGAYNPKSVFASGTDNLDVDGFYASGGNQIAINAVSKELFIAKPLTMISTWDGDEWSLQIFTEALLRFLESTEL
jgi:4-aminobutyrate aminotransferase-like enzyme